jgi:hypothetical protein
MSGDLKADILKAVADVKNTTNNTSKNTTDTPIVLKNPQILQHSLDESLRQPRKLNENVNE